MTRKARKSPDYRFIWKKDDIAITRAHVFLEDRQRRRAEETLCAAKEDLEKALQEAPGR
jgi:hypothetical protein